MKIHLQTLIDNGACASQTDLFRKMFGDSVNVTQKLCVSVADKFDFGWAADHLLTSPERAEYERITAPAWADYQRARAAAQADFERIRAAALADYVLTQARAFVKVYNGRKK